MRLKLRKAQIVAAVTVIALMAVTAASASASVSGFTADTYPATVESAPDGTESSVLATHTLGSRYCTNPHFSTVLTGENVYYEGALLAPSPEDASCIYFFKSPLEMHGCQFILHPGAETEKGVFGGTFDIGGGKCTGITFKSAYCNTTFGPQAGGTASFVNQGSGSSATVKVTLQMSSLKHTENFGMICSGGKTYSDGSYSISWLVQAKDGAGASTGIHVSKVPALVWQSGEVFEANTYPVDVAGEKSSGAATFETTVAGKATCGSASFTASATESVASVLVNPSYSGCKLAGVFNSTVNMHTCRYKIYAAGTADVACAVEGDTIDIAVPVLGCHITIPAQSGLKIKLTNEWGVWLKGDVNLSGLSYSTNEPCPGAAGSFTDGTFTDSETMYGYRG